MRAAGAIVPIDTCRLLSACAPVPPGPGVLVLPETTKGFGSVR